ncbi:hypothetical protein FHS27_000004 [Rhodopirellula rubra]|uniref:Uncharacterized protein n=1 Tax=Aporhodopirellula rubra TaxID=980271 RepID=A0A7W5DTG8_9BACT|nr:hypothetical protein [Aporhodopirellula rubra]MBB3204240.1 hypothetical protein [Aporhodopirellula rubra]
MKNGRGLTEENLDTEIGAMLDGKSLLVDPALVEWCKQHYEELKAHGDKRKLSKVGNTYDNIYLMWSFINGRGDPKDDNWAKVRQYELKKIVDSNGGLSDLKILFDAEGWADWKEGTPHRMKIIPTDDPVLVDLSFKTTDRILGSFTDDDPACKYSRHALDRTEVIEDEAKQIIRNIYLSHIDRRDWIKETGLFFIPNTRDEENKWNELRDIGEYNRWMMAKAGRVNASIIQPALQIRAGGGAVFRVSKSHGHRLFSPFTFLKRELRKSLRLDGERLTALDICSCQITLLANKTADPDLLGDCLGNEFYSKVSEYLEPRSAHPLLPDPEMDMVGEEELKWIEEKWPALRTPTRERAKFAVMEYLFGPNRTKEKHEKKDQFLIQEFMFENYKRTAQYVYDLKEEKPFRQVARELQAAESRLFIDQYYNTDLRQAGILGHPVHDAVYVKESDADRAEEVFRERIRKSGLKAKLSRE